MTDEDGAGAGGDASEGDVGGVSRRQLLGGGLALGAVGTGAYLLLDDSSGPGAPEGDGGGNTTTTATPPADEGLRTPFGVWEELQAGLQASPDHLAGTAVERVDRDDPETLFEFVRDDLALKPPSPTGNDGFASRADAGPTATLRAGMGTPRETADLLARLLERAGYESEVVAYDRGLSAERTRELYFDGPDHEFDPGFDEDDLQEWADLMGEDEDSPDEIELVDEDGAESASLGERVRDALPDDAADAALGFDHGLDGGPVPVVRFRDPGDGGTADDTATAQSTTTAATTTTAGTDAPDAASDWQYADLFHADESFGDLQEPSNVAPAPDLDAEGVTVTLETARMDAPEERIELVSGDWDATELAGRHLEVNTLPGRSPLDDPTLTFDDVSTFVPALARTDPGTDLDPDRNRSVWGDPFTLTGDRYTVNDAGNLSRGGVLVHEGEDEWDLLLETPDGEELPVEPIVGDESLEDYYSYDTENGAASDTTDGLERRKTVVMFLYRNGEGGSLHLVLVVGHPDGDDGGGLRVAFEGTGGMGWTLYDDRPINANKGPYETETGERIYRTEGDRMWVTWEWSSGYTDGGAIGTLTPPFDVEVTSEAEWEETNTTTERDGMDRWVFVNGDDLDDPIELADFGENTGDVATRVFTELISEGETVREPIDPPSADDVASVDVTASGDTYPEIRVTVDARDADGDPVADLPPNAVAVLEDDDPVGAELDPTLGDDATHTFTYRTLNRETDDEDRSVTVSVTGGDEGETSYTVPDDATDPRTETGLCGLYLRVTVGDRTARRTLAGWDPELDADRDPDEDDHEEVVSALWGSYTLSFESAGVPSSVTLDDELAGKLSKEPLHEAVQSGDVEEMRSVDRQGDELVSQLPAPFHPRLPDRTTDDSLTYGVGVRTVLVGARPVFGEGVERRSVDLLDTSTIRTVTDDGDPQRAFDLTLDRTARRSVLERANFETGTASLLDGADLTPGEGATGEMDDAVADRFSTASDRRAVTDADHRLTAASGETAAFWHVDGETGDLVGVLPDGSGGGEGEGIIELLERIDRVVQLLDEAASHASDALKGRNAAIAEYYGQTLSRLYAIAAGSVATLSTETYEEEVAAAISAKVCELAGTITDGDWFPDEAQSGIASFMNNIHTAKNHSDDSC